MELAFDTLRLRTVCENEAQAVEQFGEKVAEALKHRLADLRAAPSLVDIPAGHPRPLEETGEKFAVLLREGWRMVFRANHPKRRRQESGNIDWSNVSRIKICRIENING